MPTATELAFAPAHALAELIRTRKLSSRELLELYLDRIAAHDGPLNSVVTLDAERARARALQLDDMLAAGSSLGPLHGVPLTIKDTHETAGLRTTCGARQYADHVPSTNAAGVQRLVDAGAIVFGKTNVPPYAADVQAYNELFGVTRNPHDLGRTPGGSSGGCAVAVACGFTAFEFGSDIGGSIRTPANWTGVYGHKPTYGLVPTRGHMPPAPGTCAELDLNVCGPLARSAEDLAFTLDVLAGPDPAYASASLRHTALPAARARTLGEYRIAVWLDDPAFPVDREVGDVLDRAASALERAGARIDRNARPDMPLAEIHDNYRRLLDPLLCLDYPQKVMDEFARRAQTPRPQGADDPLTAFARRATASHVDWLHADERRTRYRLRWAEFFRRFDALLCPVTPMAALAHDHEGSPLTRSVTINGTQRPYADVFGWISMATGAYLPATVAPVGKTASGLPVGIQIIGPYLEDRTPIDIAARMASVVGGYAPPAGMA